MCVSTQAEYFLVSKKWLYVAAKILELKKIRPSGVTTALMCFSTRVFGVNGNPAVIQRVEFDFLPGIFTRIQVSHSAECCVHSCTAVVEVVSRFSGAQVVTRKKTAVRMVPSPKLETRSRPGQGRPRSRKEIQSSRKTDGSDNPNVEDDDDDDDQSDGNPDARALELSRWPPFATQILKDVFTERLDQLLKLTRGQRESRATATVRRGRISLRDMLGEVLQDTQRRVREKYEVCQLSSERSTTFDSHEMTSEQVRRVCSTKKLSVSSLPYLLQSLFDDGILRLQAQEDQHLGKELGSLLRLPVSVYASPLQTHWAARAATEFLCRIEEIGRKIWSAGGDDAVANGPVLNIGIVGGTTVQMIIQQLKESEDWDLDFGVNPGLWGSVRILALNVCLTRAEELPSNANVLVNELREAMERQVSRGSHGATICGVGLLATLLKPSDPTQYDEDLIKLLEITDPSLLGKAADTERSNNKTESQLHIVLTSIGAAKGSIFSRYDLMESNESKRSKMVGDLLYTCFDSEGEIVELTNKKGEPYSLFSAVSLNTLEKLVGSQDRSVILVARKNPGGERKHVAIHSALQNHKYASCLILDRETARDLFNRHQAMQ